VTNDGIGNIEIVLSTCQVFVKLMVSYDSIVFNAGNEVGSKGKSNYGFKSRFAWYLD
jgi:hypothetical protein